MGKKINYKTKGKADKNAKKDLQPATREMIINLHKQLHGENFKKKAPKAVKVIKELARQTWRQVNSTFCNFFNSSD